MTEIETKAAAYILSCIDPSGYDEVAETDADKISFMYHTFIVEYGWMVDHIGITEALSSYFAGLPSCCTVEWYNYDIINRAITWEMIPANANDSQLENLLDNWFDFMAKCTVKLFRRYYLI